MSRHRSRREVIAIFMRAAHELRVAGWEYQTLAGLLLLEDARQRMVSINSDLPEDEEKFESLEQFVDGDESDKWEFDRRTELACEYGPDLMAVAEGKLS